MTDKTIETICMTVMFLGGVTVMWLIIRGIVSTSSSLLDIDSTLERIYKHERDMMWRSEKPTKAEQKTSVELNPTMPPEPPPMDTDYI